MDKAHDQWLEAIGVSRDLLARRVAQLSPAGTSVSAAPARPAKSPPPPPAPELISIVITVPAPLEPGGQQPLTATGKFSNDSSQNLTNTVKWSSDTDVVKVAPGGMAKVGSGGSGKVTITATAAGGGVSGSITVTIRLALQDIIVTPQNPLLESGKTLALTATAVFADGDTEDISDKVVWETSKPKVVDFMSVGLCLAAAAGTSMVTATDAATQISGATKITVPAAGQSPTLSKVTISPLNPDIKDGKLVSFKAMGVYSDGSTHEIANVTWESSHPETLSIDKKGVAKAGLVEGQPLIRGSDPATHLFQSTTCYVTQSGVKSITVSPKSITLISGDAAPVTVTAALYGGGTRVVNDLVKWTIFDSKAAKMILAGAQVEGGAPGGATIEAFEPISQSSDTFSLTVLPPVLRSIMVMGSATIPNSQTEQYTATGFFSDHTSNDNLRGLKWSSSNPAIEINQKGEATAKTAGKATITAEDPATHRTGTIEVKVV